MPWSSGPGIRRHGAGARDDACQRLHQQCQREALGAAERLQQAAAHPLLRHGLTGVLEHAHLAERRDAGREIDDEVRRAGPRDPGRQRVRGEPRREPARRRHGLLRAGVVGEGEQDDAVSAGAIRVVREAAAVPGAAHRDGGDAVLARPLGGEVGRERADDLAERSVPVHGDGRALVAHDLGARRGDDRAVARGRRVLDQPSQSVRRMPAHLRAHEQLGRAVRVGRARAEALGDVAREDQGPGCGDRRHAGWTLGRDPMGEGRRARFRDGCHRVPNDRRPSTAPRSRRASRGTSAPSMRWPTMTSPSAPRRSRPSSASRRRR